MRVSPIARLGLTGLIALIAAMPVKAENAAHDIANKFSETTSKAAEPQDDLRRKTYEAEMLERARQEARERADAELRAAAEAEARRKDMEAQREAESLALADKLKRAQDARKAKAADASEEKSFKPALTNTDKAAVKPATGAADGPDRCQTAHGVHAASRGRARDCSCSGSSCSCAAGRCSSSRAGNGHRERARASLAAAYGAGTSGSNFAADCVCASRSASYNSACHGAWNQGYPALQQDG